MAELSASSGVAEASADVPLPPPPPGEPPAEVLALGWHAESAPAGPTLVVLTARGVSAVALSASPGAPGERLRPSPAPAATLPSDPGNPWAVLGTGGGGAVALGRRGEVGLWVPGGDGPAALVRVPAGSPGAPAARSLHWAGPGRLVVVWADGTLEVVGAPGGAGEGAPRREVLSGVRGPLCAVAPMPGVGVLATSEAAVALGGGGAPPGPAGDAGPAPGPVAAAGGVVDLRGQLGGGRGAAAAAGVAGAGAAAVPEMFLLGRGAGAGGAGGGAAAGGAELSLVLPESSPPLSGPGPGPGAGGQVSAPVALPVPNLLSVSGSLALVASSAGPPRVAIYRCSPSGIALATTVALSGGGLGDPAARLAGLAPAGGRGGGPTVPVVALSVRRPGAASPFASAALSRAPSRAQVVLSVARLDVGAAGGPPAGAGGGARREAVEGAILGSRGPVDVSALLGGVAGGRGPGRRGSRADARGEGGGPGAAAGGRASAICDAMAACYRDDAEALGAALGAGALPPALWEHLALAAVESQSVGCLSALLARWGDPPTARLLSRAIETRGLAAVRVLAAGAALGEAELCEVLRLAYLHDPRAAEAIREALGA